jgi:hypothetical protein
LVNLLLILGLILVLKLIVEQHTTNGGVQTQGQHTSDGVATEIRVLAGVGRRSSNTGLTPATGAVEEDRQRQPQQSATGDGNNNKAYPTTTGSGRSSKQLVLKFIRRLIVGLTVTSLVAVAWVGATQSIKYAYLRHKWPRNSWPFHAKARLNLHVINQFHPAAPGTSHRSSSSSVASLFGGNSTANSGVSLRYTSSLADRPPISSPATSLHAQQQDVSIGSLCLV